MAIFVAGLFLGGEPKDGPHEGRNKIYMILGL